MALKNIHVLGGVIDADYKKSVSVVIANLSDEPFEIKIGDRICQLIIEKAAECVCEEVDDLGDVKSERKSGFGSSGIKSKDQVSTQIDSD